MPLASPRRRRADGVLPHHQLFRAAASIAGEGVTLRTPQMTDYGEWAALREASRDFLMPWEPTWPADDLTRGAFRRRIRRYAEDLRTDQGYAFLIVRNTDGALVGGLTLANIRRGVAQAGSLGYWMGVPFVRQGYMTAAVRAVIPFAFATLRLHRLEAACIPTNAASIRLLEKTGFVREGYAREYLCINGIWQDHLLYARLTERGKFLTKPSTQRAQVGALGWPRLVCYHRGSGRWVARSQSVCLARRSLAVSGKCAGTVIDALVRSSAAIAALLALALLASGCSGGGSIFGGPAARPDAGAGRRQPAAAPGRRLCERACLSPDNVANFFSARRQRRRRPVAGAPPDVECPYIQIRAGRRDADITPAAATTGRWR